MDACAPPCNVMSIAITVNRELRFVSMLQQLMMSLTLLGVVCLNHWGWYAEVTVSFLVLLPLVDVILITITPLEQSSSNGKA
jgi:hypothetical protein